ANANIELLSGLVSAATPLIGIEPSAILTFRDEYIDLADKKNKTAATTLAANSFTIEEFLSKQAVAGLIDRSLFSSEKMELHIHGHCYQKALSTQQSILDTVQLPVNFKAKLIPSGCCGMAGGFGYEKEHYEISQQVGELVLFPAVKAIPEHDIIVASGTSCRHQVKDGTSKKALHPVEVLFDALVK
ncbi:MAG: FAD-binding oxidoreductase, partial [Chitinophagaceae bacterium]|nr:FAD-binding oxidoreductase [Chitinophagaceae bacterium]